MSQPRRLPFEGAINFRDLGGYPAGPGRQTRWSRIYRSDSLAELTDPDLERLSALGLYGICDYRLPGEAAKNPDRLPDGHGMRVTNPGFLPRGTERMLDGIAAGTMTAGAIQTEVIGHYRLFAQEHIADYIPFFRMLLEADGRPVLIHCTSGKDRTGWGSALALLAAGCADGTVIRDYVLTDTYRRDVGFMFPDGVDAGAMDMLTSARPIYIETALSELRRLHGTGDGWMDLLGLDGSERAQLRNLLSVAG
ncbi:tyrosine-protein phosphatase [Chachezhania sediminis]|uniref:tyrosine-protein phosphatase n=1 Tax=Chachezhania sediminis TaxID=2599291 RepID=UPI00131E0187|nr:tyrosine-protein phosphatase [Chachezhania sediminis]